MDIAGAVVVPPPHSLLYELGEELSCKEVFMTPMLCACVVMPDPRITEAMVMAELTTPMPGDFVAVMYAQGRISGRLIPHDRSRMAAPET